MSILAVAMLFFSSAGCQSQTLPPSLAASEKTPSSVVTENKMTSSSETTPSTQSNVLVAYFSATGNTEKIAGWIAEESGGTLYQITPETPYTSADLNYKDSSSRATMEQSDLLARPKISGVAPNMGNYDVMYLGYPIWWGQAPKIISTFLESHDFSGKAIVPFCTSNSSGIGSSDTNLHGHCADSANWLTGKRFDAMASRGTVKKWIDGLGIQRGRPQDVGLFTADHHYTGTCTK